MLNLGEKSIECFENDHDKVDLETTNTTNIMITILLESDILLHV